MKKYLKSIYNLLSIKTKWGIFVSILIIYPIVLIGFVGYRNYDKVITKHFVTSVQKEVLNTSDQVKERIHSLEAFTKSLQHDDTIYNFTQSYYHEVGGMRGPALDAEEIEKYKYAIMMNYELAQSVESYLRSIVLSKPEITLGAYQFIEQKEIGYIVSKSKSYKEEKAFREHKIFENMKAILVGKNKTGYYVDEAKNIYIGQKIYDRNTFRESGIIVFKINPQYLLGKYEAMLGESKEAIAVMGNQQKELLEVGNVSQGRKNKLIRFMAMDPEENTIYKEENKTEVVVYTQLKSYNLSLVSAVFISRRILLKDIRMMSWFIFLLCMIAIPIFYFLANKLYKEVIHPVYVLSDKMHQIENGEIGVKVESDRRDEFGYLFTAFNKMSHQIQYLINCVYKEQLALKNAELKSLQAQIKPHFLYNTLEMINWKARMSGNEDLAEMIEALSGIMEINIDRRSSKFLSVNEEIRYLNNYMFLIEKRFGNKIKFETWVDENTNNFMIPRLILQPLVENAIGHGIEPIGRGTIGVKIKQENNDLIITVQDDGVGIEETGLEQLKQKINALNKVDMQGEENKRESIGVINVQRRIKLLYGLKYGLTIKSKQGEGTQIVIILPITLTGEL